MKKLDSKTALGASAVGAGISISVTEAMASAGYPFWLRVLVGTAIVGLVVFLISLVPTRKSQD